MNCTPAFPPTRVRPLLLALLTAALALPAPVGAQGPRYDQDDVGALLDRQGRGGPVPDAVAYAPYVLRHASGNTVRARHELYRWAGEGDLALGRAPRRDGRRAPRPR